MGDIMAAMMKRNKGPSYVSEMEKRAAETGKKEGKFTDKVLATSGRRWSHSHTCDAMCVDMRDAPCMGRVGHVGRVDLSVRCGSVQPRVSCFSRCTVA